MNYRNISLFSMVFLFLIIVGFYQSWNVAFGLLNLCLLSAIMALGVNIQWGYAGLFSIGTVGFVALGGVAAVVTSMPPVEEAWRTGGPGIITALIAAAVTIIASIQVWKRLPSGLLRNIVMIVVLLGGFFHIPRFIRPSHSNHRKDQSCW
jgi:branched-chain amino acid transport system permease protein